MTTYTIAIDNDSGMLLATAPDGNDEMMQERLADTLSQFNAEDPPPVITYYDGLTLYAETPDDDDVDLIYIGTSMGFLQDADGQMIYAAAGYPTATA